MNQRADCLLLAETVVPPDQDALADAVRRAWQNGTAVYPIGGGTQLAYGLRPGMAGLGLSLNGLNRVIDYPVRDLTITVEAGVTVRALAERLATEGQRLPVDVPSPSQATVGGAVAVNAAGPRQFRWGAMRDYVIGVRAVDGMGNVFGGGGRVVKNAAGYDLCRLLTGSFGTLGVIVQVTLMVKPKPDTSAFVACEWPDVAGAEGLLAKLVQTKTLPTAVELLAGPAWQQDPALGPISQPRGVRLVVGFEGSAAEVEWMVAQLLEEWRQAKVVSPQTVAGDAVGPLWDRLTQFPLAASPTDGEGAVVVQIHVLPGAVIPIVRRVREMEPNISIQAHAGSGMIVARLDVASGEVESLVVQRLRPEVRSAGGHLVVLAQPPGVALSGHAVFGPEPPGWAVMQAIKNRFDPKNILNRGRFLLGHVANPPREQPPAAITI